MHEPYSDYAAIYDRIGQDLFGEQMAALVLNRVQPTRALRVLDLACGTGAATLALAAAGHRVTGIDRSASMLERAQAKAHQARLDVALLRADLRVPPTNLPPASYDLATCFFDSLNYLVGDGDLAQICAYVGRLLRPGGRFIFDLNMPAEHVTWEGRDEVVYDSDDLLVYNRLSYDAERQLASGRVVWFMRTGQHWLRREETHLERAWSGAEVLAALTEAGFTLLALLTPEGEPADDDAPRIVYDALKGAV